MKKILVVFTGGTIGSIATKGIIHPSDATQFQLLQQFQQHYTHSRQISFTSIQPLRLLSENLAPAAWKIIITAIEAKTDRYDGIIITHGTDTLAYTAAALSFYFHAFNVPIMLVSSNYPLVDSRANGLENFITAVEFICTRPALGHQNPINVLVPYRNPRQRAIQLHSGARLASSLQLSGDFFSVQDKAYMQFENGQFSVLNPPVTQTQINTFSLKADFSERILMIKPYPGLNYANFNLQQVDAVLHDLYHSGTACTSMQWGKNHSLPEFIRQCTERHIKVYMAPAIPSTEAYQTTRALLAEGAEMIWNISIEAAYVKLMLAYGNFKDKQQIMDFINSDIAGEHIQ
jgi:L-asparaginase/Glu-tRNA(Gln) amidotransferase subunit D